MRVNRPRPSHVVVAVEMQISRLFMINFSSYDNVDERLLSSAGTNDTDRTICSGRELDLGIVDVPLK